VSSLSLVTPSDSSRLVRLGKGSREKTRAYLIAIAAFLEGKPENTRLTYGCALKQFFELFDWISPEDVTVAEATYFKKALMKRGLADATVYNRLAALQSFFNFLMKPHGATAAAGLVQSNPFQHVGRSDVKPSPYGRSTPADWNDFEKCIEALPADVGGFRDKAVLLFYAYTGRRRSEVARLRVKDLNVKTTPRTYTVMTKGHKVRTFELPVVVYEAIRAYWIMSGRIKNLHPEAGVFTAVATSPTPTDHPDRPISPRLMTNILKRAAKRANVDPASMKIHGLRHMAARDLDRANVKLQDIQAFLDHASPATTAIYIHTINRTASSHEVDLQRVREAARKMALDAT